MNLISRCLFFGYLLVISIVQLLATPPLRMDRGNRCYQCSSIEEGECGERFNKSKVTIASCTRDKICFKIITAVHYPPVRYIDRGCGKPDYCFVQGRHVGCYTCKYDLCNSGPRCNSYQSLLGLFSLLLVGSVNWFVI